jgi:hypothetical protein
MSLVGNIADLALAIGRELKSRITADHPGVAKAWVCFGYVGNAIVIRASFNVLSVTRLAPGKYRVNFVRPMPDAGYCWSAFARNAGKQSALKFASARVTAETKTTTYVEVICATQAGTPSDTTELNLMVFR